jgi:hypothetical protein
MARSIRLCSSNRKNPGAEMAGMRTKTEWVEEHGDLMLATRRYSCGLT